ncbi:Retrovirus-related Pol polyprotein from transposon 17.6 [Gossypium australe]|uniref:Retrovirus-related Pol polyprotein from transposon 17.6 n=1 Tax=Gossypium australe TaxID=47621 RepID=A0A5B6WXL2_9ROSI|nr:Retrovirus-related Pol polyprotein from transposon 17.6 [Gossypium australe]
MGCVLGQHDEAGKKEKAIYYLNKKFTECETRYSPIERLCCALIWTTRRLRQYMLYHTTWLISKQDPLKYMMESTALNGRIARWQILLSEFDIIYVYQKTVKGSAIAKTRKGRFEIKGILGRKPDKGGSNLNKKGAQEPETGLLVRTTTPRGLETLVGEGSNVITHNHS